MSETHDTKQRWTVVGMNAETIRLIRIIAATEQLTIAATLDRLARHYLSIR
jgi:hypothetical protein